MGWVVLSLALGALQVRLDIAARRDAFQVDARTAHRLLGQRAAQHEAILATLVLLGPGADAADTASARLPALYPQVLQVLQRSREATWPDEALARAEAASRKAGRPAVARVDPALGQFDLVLGAEPVSYALRLALEGWVPWSDWPFARGGAVRADLLFDAQVLPLQEGQASSIWAGGVTPGFVFSKALDLPGHPFVLRLQRPTGPANWPWLRLAATTAALALLMLLAATLHRQQQRRRSAEQLLRLARVSRLNTLGELAAGLAHELNQPLTAVIASTQAARRLFDEDPPPRADLLDALERARSQARRAADVVARLRRLVERPADASALQPVALDALVRELMRLLQPLLRSAGVRPELALAALTVRGDPTAIEQILHNLVDNALHALQDRPAGQRQLRLTLAERDGRAVLGLHDSGSGIAPQVLPHLFEPFNSSKPDGLGLGLSLCVTLAAAMDGRLRAQNPSQGGACFELDLPLATPP